MNKEQKKKIAISAANQWCRCFKCDGIIRDTHDKCDKEKLLTCHQWYHGYRTALLAIEEYEQQMTKGAVEGIVHHFDGNDLASIHYNDPKGVPMCYYASASGLEEGDKVNLILTKED